MPWNNVSNETCAIMFDYKCDKIFRLGWITKMKGRNEMKNTRESNFFKNFQVYIYMYSKNN